VVRLKNRKFKTVKQQQMKKLILAIMICLTAGIVSAQDVVVIDPNASVRNLDADFNKIKLSGGIDLYLSQSAEMAVAVSAVDEKNTAGIKTIVKDGVLNIYFDGDKNWKNRNRKLRAYVSFKELENIHASGGSDIIVSGTIAVTALEIQLSGACDFKGKVTVNRLKLNLSGASDVRISGTAGRVDIESSGASDVKGYDLVTDICNANASGASDINITVNKEISAHASGASDIHFKGEAVIKEMHAGGSSSVVKKGK